MKRLTYLASLLTILAGAASCQKNIEQAQPQPQPSGEYRQVTIEAGTAVSKTSVSGGTLTWSANDKLNIVPQSGSVAAVALDIKSGVGESSGTFEGQVDKTVTDVTDLYGWCGGDWTYSSGAFSVEMPATQTSVANGLAENAYPSIGTGTIKDGISLSNPMGVLILTVKGETTDLVKSISVTSAANNLAGAFTVNPASSYAVSGGSSKTITLNVASPYVALSSTGVNFYIVLPPAEYAASDLTVTVTKSDDSSFSNTFADAVTVTAGNATGKEVKNTLPAGALPGAFSVSATKKVHFSKGNLQATYSTSTSGYTWGFAANQYDYIGGKNENTSDPITGNNTIDSQTDGAKVDLFGWVGVSSTVLTGDYTKYGISTSLTGTDYGNVLSEALKNDWGTAVDNSGTWFTLSNDEWVYLLGKSTPGRDASLCKAGVTVCGNQYCLVIAPDNFTGTIAESYDASEWATAQAAGLVCLPAAGTRDGSDVWSVGESGFYWSSTSLATSNESSYCIQFFDTYIWAGEQNYRRYSGNSVRLVCEAE